ncbi:Uncharacterized protein AB751O23_AB_00220 [Chlamydiales bacterium SCGC AB-751-O23]|jgi:hypothetical protein|nr:Uncharacterized protein AB751O23_AB_00220 [Chlamydiales bacterium SCGC AB-751-O23]
MKAYLQEFMLKNWQRKVIALLSAICVWVLVNNSITVTTNVSGIPVRIHNLPQNKTVEGLLPDMTLNRRFTLTLTGSKSVMERLSSEDLEISIDASKIDNDSPLEFTKRNLTSLNPELDLYRDLITVKHNDFSIELTNLITENIPVNINIPKGDPPRGYQFVDIWPPLLIQTISGPERQVKALKKKGLEINFNLNEISKTELENIYNTNISPDDEISFDIPQEWKRVAIPFRSYTLEDLNDPKSKQLRITFLKQEHISLNRKIPVRVFFPYSTLSKLNPNQLSLINSDLISEENGIHFLNINPYATGVSRSFLNIVKDNLELTIKAVPKSTDENLPWSVEFIDSQDLENRYVQQSLELLQEKGGPLFSINQKKVQLKNRFRQYVRKFELVKPNGKKLKLDIELGPGSFTVKDVS